MIVVYDRQVLSKTCFCYIPCVAIWEVVDPLPPMASHRKGRIRCCELADEEMVKDRGQSVAVLAAATDPLR